MATLAEVRAQYPQYKDLSDDQLAGALHEKFYSDIPIDQYAKQIGWNRAPEGNPAIGAAEATGSFLSGIVAGPVSGYAGAIQGAANKLAEATGGKPGMPAADRVAQVQQAMTYQPRTQTGQRYLDTASTPFQWLANKADQAGDKVNDATGSPALATAANAGVQMIPAVLGKVLPKGVKMAAQRAAPALEQVATKGEAVAQQAAADAQAFNDAMTTARKAGYKLPPSQAGGPVGQALESASGKARTEMDLSRRNQTVTNQLAAQELGISGPITDQTLSVAKNAANQKYEAVRNMGRGATDDEYKQAIRSAGGRSDSVAADFPEDTNPAVENLRTAYLKDSFDSSSAITKIRELRVKAGKNIKSMDPQQNELGYAQRQVANALESQLERWAGQTDNPQMVADFRAARTQLAKIHTIEDALGPSGNVSAQWVAKAADRGVPLSGGLKTIADSYRSFPKALRDVDNLGGHSPFSTVDYLAGAAGALHNPPLAAAVLARPLARQAIASEAFQKASITPRSTTPKPSLGTRAARVIVKKAAPTSTNSLTNQSGDTNALILLDAQQRR